MGLLGVLVAYPLPATGRGRWAGSRAATGVRLVAGATRSARANASRTCLTTWAWSMTIYAGV